MVKAPPGPPSTILIPVPASMCRDPGKDAEKSTTVNRGSAGRTSLRAGTLYEVDPPSAMNSMPSVTAPGTNGSEEMGTNCEGILILAPQCLVHPAFPRRYRDLGSS